MYISEEFLDEANYFIKRLQATGGRSAAIRRLSDHIDLFISQPEDFRCYINLQSGGCYLIHKSKHAYVVLSQDGRLISPGQMNNLRLLIRNIQDGVGSKKLKEINTQELSERFPVFFPQVLPKTSDKGIGLR